MNRGQKVGKIIYVADFPESRFFNWKDGKLYFRIREDGQLMWTRGKFPYRSHNEENTFNFKDRVYFDSGLTWRLRKTELGETISLEGNSIKDDTLLEVVILHELAVSLIKRAVKIYIRDKDK